MMEVGPRDDRGWLKRRVYLSLGSNTWGDRVKNLGARGVGGVWVMQVFGARSTRVSSFYEDRTHVDLLEQAWFLMAVEGETVVRSLELLPSLAWNKNCRMGSRGTRWSPTTAN